MLGGQELRPPYLHQLPPVLPKNSFFSEFQINFFQLPSSLAFPRAMVAGQQLPQVRLQVPCAVASGLCPCPARSSGADPSTAASFPGVAAQGHQGHMGCKPCDDSAVFTSEKYWPLLTQ